MSIFAVMLLFYSGTGVSEEQGLMWEEYIQNQRVGKEHEDKDEEELKENNHFFESKDTGLDRNRYYYPNSTIEKEAQ